MLVAVFGDTHGNINTMYSVAIEWEKRTGLDLDLVVQVGDFGFWLSDDTVDRMTRRHAERSNEKRRAHGKEAVEICGDYFQYILREQNAPIPTLVIRGNHEDQEYLMGLEKQLETEHPEDYLTRAIEVVPNIHYLPDGHVVNWNGVRFGGLGGCFSVRTWENWNYWDKARWKRVHYGEKRRLTHFTRDRAEALRRQEVDVLLFHDAPTHMDLLGAIGLRLPEDEMTEKVYNQLGCPQLMELIKDIQPNHVFCGHWHQYREKMFGNTRCVILNQTGVPPAHDCMIVVDL